MQQADSALDDSHRSVPEQSMLQSLHIDNYKCLVNFDFSPSACQPIFGGNGTGKTSLFEVLKAIQLFVFGGTESSAVFPTRSLTRWDTRNVQTFELNVEGNGGSYDYELRIEHDRQLWRSRILKESLRFEGQSLFSFEDRQAQLFIDGGVKLGTPIPFDPIRSGLSLLQPTPANTQLTWFKSWLSRIVFLDIQPRAMEFQTETEWFFLTDGAVNFASWYRHMSQEKISAVVSANRWLEEAIEGFSSMSLVSAGERTRLLKVDFRQREVGDRTAELIRYDFPELSDGQRALIVLYNVLAFLEDSDRMLCLDEPENFVALVEIQPFLMKLRDAIGTGPAQCLLVSHHPEVINYMAADNPMILQRDEGGPVRLRPFAPPSSAGLSAAEIMARGWEDE